MLQDDSISFLVYILVELGGRGGRVTWSGQLLYKFLWDIVVHTALTKCFVIHNNNRLLRGIGANEILPGFNTFV